MERCKDVFKSHSKYALNKNDRDRGGYSNQFSIFYAARLNTIAPTLKDEARRKWGDEVHIVPKIIDSEVESTNLSSECILIGTLYKEMHLRSSILDEFKDINGLSGAVQSFQNIASNDDFVVLEDDSGRIGLCGSIEDIVPSLVTGIIIALKGKICGTGMFQVDDYLFYGDSLKPSSSSIQLKIPPVVSSSGSNNIFTVNEPRFVLFVSGLNVDGGMSEELTLSSQLLVDFIAGRLGGEEEFRIASRIVRVVIAGNSMAQPDSNNAKELRFPTTKAASVDATMSAKSCDLLLAQVLGTCPVVLMPGATDPTNITFPQQQFHPCLLPTSARFNSMTFATNPYSFDIDDKIFVGHSGQPVEDVIRQTIVKESNMDESNQDAKIESSSNKKEEERILSVLESTLRWGHLCPTAPDTLPCYPFSSDDPFVLKSNELPHVLYSGNMSQYATKLYCNPENDHRCRLISIPSFRSTGKVVLCDLSSDSLECYTMSFSTLINGDDNKENANAMDVV